MARRITDAVVQLAKRDVAWPGGNGVLAICPVTGARADACEAALRAVVAARAGMAHLDAVRQAQGLPPLPFGTALHLGDILWGNIGAVDRLDFTTIGPALNLVSRLEELCRPVGADLGRGSRRDRHAAGAAG